MDDHARYWQRNVRIVTGLLVVWFLSSYVAGILFVDALNEIRIPGTGFRLGFWFAQQGSIFVFVILIFVYAARATKLEKRFGLRDGETDDA